MSNQDSVRKVGKLSLQLMGAFAEYATNHFTDHHNTDLG